MSSQKEVPCPSLEFRLVNRLHGVPSGEIVEAKLTCVAILDPDLSNQNDLLPDGGSDVTPSDLAIDENTTIYELAQVIENNARTDNGRSIAFHSADSKQVRLVFVFGVTVVYSHFS